jgi:hypothetical protein
MTFRYLNPVLHEEVGVSSFSAHIRDENTAQIWEKEDQKLDK